MKLTDEFEPLRTWAKTRGIIRFGDIKTQLVKLNEESGELCRAVLRANGVEAVDAIGDMIVVLSAISSFLGVKLEDCINTAYQNIKSREGTLFDGNFIKSLDGTEDFTVHVRMPTAKDRVVNVKDLVPQKKKYKKVKHDKRLRQWH
jgi:hypothetical protein